MSATIKNMELIFADRLTPDQLMIDDLIGISDEVVQVVSVSDSNNGDNYHVEFSDEFGDKDVITFKHDEMISLYVYVEDEE
jgi:hypothetical protein